MSITVTGTVQQKGFGWGTWALVTEAGKTYELYEPVPQLQQAGLAVAITGQVREDIMTLAAIGPVLEIESFQLS